MRPSSPVIRTSVALLAFAHAHAACADGADAEREWAYDRESHIGKLDKGLDVAQAKGWTVVDMKNDWKVSFPGDQK